METIRSFVSPAGYIYYQIQRHAILNTGLDSRMQCAGVKGPDVVVHVHSQNEPDTRCRFVRNLTGNGESEFVPRSARRSWSVSTGDAAAIIEESEHDY
jgi:hypothetical protein